MRCEKKLPLIRLLDLPISDTKMTKAALGAINGFFSGMVADSGVDLQANIANKVCTMTLSAQCCHPHNVY